MSSTGTRHTILSAQHTLTDTDHHDKNPARVAAGLKAALHNPRVSSTAKLGAQEKLNEMWASEFKLEDGLGMFGLPISIPIAISADAVRLGDMLIDGKKLENIVRGYKATVNSESIFIWNPHITDAVALTDPRVSGEAKEHAIEILRCFQEGL